MAELSIGVLRRSAHGMPLAEYADALQDRLPDHQVRVARTPAEERQVVADCEVVTGLSIDEELLAHADAMEMFACFYAGVGHLPMDALREADVAVTNASGVHGPNMGEYVVGAILADVRRFREGWRRQQRNEWRHFQARELQESTVTVVGLGPIGEATVERLAGFGVDTIGVRYTPEKGGPTDEVVGLRDESAVHDAFARTDYLVLACPLTDETRGLVDAEAIATLPPEAVVVNVARGPVVDTDALLTALRREDLRGAVLDVTDPEPLPADHPLWDLGNVTITPHNAGHTPEYYRRLADVVAENVRTVEATGARDELRNQV